MRERLLKLIKEADDICSKTKRCDGCIGFGKGAECINYIIADHLLANGVIVLPCKVGDKVWCIDGFCDESFEVVERIIVSFTKFKNSIHFYAEKPTNPGWVRTYGVDNFGKTVFLTREEAEAALKGR